MPPELLDLLQGILTTSPNRPAGDVADVLPQASSPVSSRSPDMRSREDQVMELLLQLLQGMLQGQSAVPSQNAVAGAQGGAFGGLGGRPPAGSVPPSAL